MNSDNCGEANLLEGVLSVKQPGQGLCVAAVVRYDQSMEGFRFRSAPVLNSGLQVELAE